MRPDLVIKHLKYISIPFLRFRTSSCHSLSDRLVMEREKSVSLGPGADSLSKDQDDNNKQKIHEVINPGDRKQSDGATGDNWGVSSDNGETISLTLCATQETSPSLGSTAASSQVSLIVERILLLMHTVLIHTVQKTS